MTPYQPKYIPPKQKEEERARLMTTVFWIAVAVPVTFAFLAFGYSDQAPAALRSATISFDRALGFPVASLISLLGR
jgi:hypothetical protein